MDLFRNDLEGTFAARPNRFIIDVSTPAGQVRAHCPNPGRMQELLLPGAPVILEEAPGWKAETDRISRKTGGDREKGKSRALRKTRYSLAACRYRGKIIPLDSSRANLAAELLVLPRLFPDAVRTRREVKLGSSRFDFLVTEGGRDHIVEVKACTLCEYGVAMFPDAPTLRGTRHLEELAKSAAAGYVSHIVFVVFHPEAARFVPNIHTDPVFAHALAAAMEGGVRAHAVVFEASAAGEARLLDTDIPVDTSPALLSEENRGVYLLVLRIPGGPDGPGGPVEVGSLGEIDFPGGYYVYVGSAAKNLNGRIARHLRLRKKLRWHIDYLRAAAVSVRAYPIRTRLDLECSLASEIGPTSDGDVPRFGSSDCSCRSHLFYYRDDPFARRSFVDILFRYRHRDAFGPVPPGS